MLQSNHAPLGRGRRRSPCRCVPFPGWSIFGCLLCTLERQGISHLEPISCTADIKSYTTRTNRRSREPPGCLLQDVLGHQFSVCRIGSLLVAFFLSFFDPPNSISISSIRGGKRP